MSVYLIAELGSCHDGDWAKVERMVADCAASGFSACKLQYWSSADRLADRRRATPEYRAIYRKHRIPPEWLPMFWSLCHRHGLEAVCTAYLSEDVPAIAPYVDRIKIASFENEDRRLIEACVATGKPVIMSAGMGSVEAIDTLSGICILSCVSAYPAPIDGAMQSMYDGYSDHTHNVWTGACAVIAGAEVIEVHVRASDTSPDNPDYATALDPDEARRYAEGVRTAERLIADVPVDESAMRQFKVKAATP